MNRNVSQAALKELISSTLSPSTLRPIVLSSLSLSDSLSHLHLNGGSNAEGESLLNGLYVRHVESSGILILAFFNALYAQAARVFLSSRGGSTEATLEALVDRDDGEDRWLSSQLVTADMVMQVNCTPIFKGSWKHAHIHRRSVDWRLALPADGERRVLCHPQWSAFRERRRAWYH